MTCRKYSLPINKIVKISKIDIKTESLFSNKFSVFTLLKSKNDLLKLFPLFFKKEILLKFYIKFFNNQFF